MSGSGLLYLSDNPVKFPPVTRSTPVFYDETNQEIFAMAGDLVTIYNAVSFTPSFIHFCIFLTDLTFNVLIQNFALYYHVDFLLNLIS